VIGPSVTAFLAAFLAAGARGLGGLALDGTLFAAVVALAMATLLRRSGGRLQALIWRAALLQFVLVRPFALNAVPVHGDVPRALQASAQPGGHAAWWTAAAGAYTAGVLLLLVRMFASQRRLRRQIASYAPAEPAILARVRAAAAALSLRTLPEVRVADAPLVPFTWGPLRPKLVLPRWLCVPGQRLDAVLLHELAHLQRGDHRWICLERAIVTLLFFWPPVHWVSRQLDLARELACDQRVIQRGGFSVAGYGAHLIQVVLAARDRLSTGGALAIGRSASRLELRIDRLIEQDGARRSRWLEAAALLLLAAGALTAVRPVPPPTPPFLAPGPYGEGHSAANMCLAVPESTQPACRQGCGTPCALP
jgi:Zn-dependent protease with chaperone function